MRSDKLGTSSRVRFVLSALLLSTATFVVGCLGTAPSAPPQSVPQDERWGVYVMDLDSQHVDLIYSAPDEIMSLQLSGSGEKLAFSQKFGGDTFDYDEIVTVGVDGSGPRRLTDNDTWDLYPTWSADDSRLAFLSMRGEDLDIYVMGADGSDPELLFDSGSHDADVHWQGGLVAFTAESRIWIMNEDGTDAHPITDPPRAGEWGNANLPFGDFDPRISPDGSRIVFERMVDDQSPNGNYDLFVVEVDGANPRPLTTSGYSQGLPSWSHDGERIVYVVAAVEDRGVFDLYLVNADGTENRDITPGYFPDQFLCHSAVFSADDKSIYFIGEWWSSP